MKPHCLCGCVAQLVAVELGGPGLVLQLRVRRVAVVLPEKRELKNY